MNNIITVQPYYKVERIMTRFEQKTVFHDRVLYLYTTKIVSAFQEFPLDEIYDISYKSIGQGHGVLYLHTKQGVVPFTVESDSKVFINEFRKLKNK